MILRFKKKDVEIEPNEKENPQDKHYSFPHDRIERNESSITKIIEKQNVELKQQKQGF